ncbi:Xylulose kinase [Moorella thermoacetica]|uniref:FGGY-family carbohydrate kinase n=1 Tax=Neomoorella thermoacetica TaxID=1525 RepID=UPI0030CBFF23
MGRKYLMGIDIGTTGTKAGLFDLEGNLLADAYEESVLHYPQPGWVEQEAEDFYRTTCLTVRRVLEKSRINPADIAAIAFDGQMAGILGIDDDWQPVTRYDSWLDIRCQEYVDWIRENYNDIFINTVGMPPTVAHGPKMLWWKNEEPKTFKRIAKFIVPAVYVVGRICGLKAEEAFVDHTYLHFSGVSDARNLAWSPEMLDLFDLPLEKMPRIVEPWQIVGCVTAKAAGDTGLATGIPVAAGAGDHAASCLGAGLVEKGLMVDVAGTASILSCCVDRFVPDVAHRTIIMPRAIPKDLWLPHAYIGGGGLCLRWFRDTFALAEKEQAQRQGNSAYDLLNKKAAAGSPGSGGLLFIPHLGGRVYPYDSNVRGAWIGFSWNHEQGGFYRSIMESIAYEYCYYLNIEKQLYPELEFKEVRVIGGGARSDLWNQMKANILGIPYVKLDRDEVGILGSAILAGYAAGIYRDLKTVAQNLSCPGRRYEVDYKLHQFYQPYAELYAEVFTSLAPIYMKLVKLARKVQDLDLLKIKEEEYL